MKLPIRYFAIGILTASLVFAISFYFFNETSTDFEKESIEDVTSFLENEGYRVLTEDEYISLSVNGAAQSQEDEVDEAQETDENEDEEDSGKEQSEEPTEDNQAESDEDAENAEKEETVITYTLQVEPNMLAPSVSKLLLDNKIIDDAQAFTRYLEDKNYSKYIQLGKHEVNSDMSFNEIAEEITNH